MMFEKPQLNNKETRNEAQITTGVSGVAFAKTLHPAG